MSNYVVTISVDEDQLREITENSIDPIEDLIFQEFYWLALSGISLIEVKEE